MIFSLPSLSGQALLLPLTFPQSVLIPCCCCPHSKPSGLAALYGSFQTPSISPSSHLSGLTSGGLCFLARKGNDATSFTDIKEDSKPVLPIDLAFTSPGLGTADGPGVYAATGVRGSALTGPARVSLLTWSVWAASFPSASFGGRSVRSVS